MLKPSSPAATVPGMTDTLDFVKNLWGSMSIPGTNMSGIPGMSAMSGLASPALSADELEKRIADLKAVESWLNMNLTMLRGTIQGMEVQRSTLVTLKTMGASMAEAMRQSGVSADKMAAMPFASFFGQPAAAAPSAAAGAPAGKPHTASGGGNAQPGAGAPQGDASQAGAADKSPGAEAASAASMGMPAAMAWWNLLQEQFTQAVTTAMTPASGAAGSSAAPAAAASDLGKAAPPPEAKTGGAAPEGGSVNGNGGAAGSNGKGRGGRPKADKA
ncbi:hypothetical protein HH212_05600 [Massilia forsythiae]|uniref:Uncharacterized protein n=1 Tax=Massilia forsythiae TaxID=2728020 RepID=A0A7Z2ZT23_9BURK|nr:PhaM family polyhydroxyalkanoate granule multifunctional regulatory protein [Massilia forsythiae]QJD99561.1 hypothetical protein HH212_05600 [Massilia forsythiae]